jgi:hypothetical protein
MLHPDRPIANVDDDLLGYGRFATTLAKTILNQGIDDGIVIAVDGLWGSGKSSAINMALDALTKLQAKEKVVEDKRSVIVRFEPWMVTGQANLTVEFFALLGKKLEEPLGKQASKAVAKILSLTIGSFGSIMDAAGVAAAASGQPHVGALAKLFKFMLKRRLPKDLAELYKARKELCEILLDSKRQIVVVIDDIDRLEPAEMREVMGMLKSVADFPAMVYLLPADFNVVARAVAEAGKRTAGAQIDGKIGYLEKIIQVKLDLPQPTHQGLWSMLVKHLHEARGGRGRMDTEDFETIAMLVLHAFIKTPRAIVQLSNALKVSWSALDVEVYFPDLVAVEAIRIFAPEAYGYIRRQPDKFVQLSTKDISTPFDELAKTSPHIEGKQLRELIQRLFPKSTSFYSDRSALAGWRVFQQGGFDLYFRWNLSPGFASVAQFSKLQAMINEGGEIGSFLEAELHDSLNGLSTVESLLTAITSERVAIDPSPFHAVISLLNVAHRLKSKTRSMSAMPLSWQVQHAVAVMLEKFPPDTRDVALGELLVNPDLSPEGGSTLLKTITKVLSANAPRPFKDSTVIGRAAERWVTERLSTPSALHTISNLDNLLYTIEETAGFETAANLASANLTDKLFASRLLISYTKEVLIDNEMSLSLSYPTQRPFVSAEQLIQALSGTVDPGLSKDEQTRLRAALAALMKEHS